jgi:S1-C subfamily serine protease
MKKTPVAFVLLIFAIGFLGGMVVWGRVATPPTAVPAASAGQPAAAVPVSLPAAPSQATVRVPAAGLPDLSGVAEAALRVAANISSTQTVRVRSELPWFFFDDGDQLQQSQSLGSGVVVTSDGYVLTNTHVIGDTRADVRVTLHDGRERPGRIVGIDDVSDLAVVKVDATGLSTLPWGDSDKLRVAQWVLAVGNPFQLSGTVTFGIVSTEKKRSAAQVGSEYADFIQTDAAINPGNSGGALVNAQGELVGINSRIYTETGGYQGIGFAIPSNTARKIMTELIQNGSVRWGSLGGGIRWFELDRQTARNNGLGDIAGLYVAGISPEASLYRGGLRRSDIVTAFNGQPVTSVDQLNRLVVVAQVGSRATLDVVRDGRRTRITVPIVARETMQPARTIRR